MVAAAMLVVCTIGMCSLAINAGTGGLWTALGLQLLFLLVACMAYGTSISCCRSATKWLLLGQVVFCLATATLAIVNIFQSPYADPTVEELAGLSLGTVTDAVRLSPWGICLMVYQGINLLIALLTGIRVVMASMGKPLFAGEKAFLIQTKQPEQDAEISPRKANHAKAIEDAERTLQTSRISVQEESNVITPAQAREQYRAAKPTVAPVEPISSVDYASSDHVSVHTAEATPVLESEAAEPTYAKEDVDIVDDAILMDTDDIAPISCYDDIVQGEGHIDQATEESFDKGLRSDRVIHRTRYKAESEDDALYTDFAYASDDE